MNLKRLLLLGGRRITCIEWVKTGSQRQHRIKNLYGKETRIPNLGVVKFVVVQN
jgi:hypothetical protein